MKPVFIAIFMRQKRPEFSQTVAGVSEILLQLLGKMRIGNFFTLQPKLIQMKSSQIPHANLWLLAFIIGSFLQSELHAQSVTLSKKVPSVQAGTDVSLNVETQLSVAGIVQAQLVGADWKPVAEKWKEIEAGNQTTTLTLAIPSDVASGKNYFWQLLLYDRQWKKEKEAIVKDVEIQAVAKAKPPEGKTAKGKTANSSADKMPDDPKPEIGNIGSATVGPDWTPPGNWSIQWQDEFDGSGIPENWHPFLGYTPPDFSKRTEKGLRWNGKTEDSSQMYSAKSGHHWLNGEGQLVLRIATDKAASNANGTKVDAAYLMTGYPEKWDKSEPHNVKWGGKFFSPAEAPLQI